MEKELSKVFKEMMREPENIKELLDLHKEHLNNLEKTDFIKGALREVELIEDWAKKNKVDLSKCKLKEMI